jgi:hypothetical protein
MENTMSKVLRNNAKTTVSSTNIQWCWLPNNFDKATDVTLSPLESTWAKILAPQELSLDDDDEALLLCACSDSEWVTWIPSRGETILNVHQFCLTPN